MISIGTINRLFDRIPSWKKLSDTEKIKLFHKAYLKLIKLKDETEIINEITDLGQQIIPSLNIYKFNKPSRPNLSAYGSDYNMIEELVHLSDAERIVILNIAQTKISTWRNAAAYQEYKFDTHREDLPVFQVIYQPSLRIIQEILDFILETITFTPILNLRSKIIALLLQTDIYIPELSFSQRIWKAVGMIKTYLPSLAVKFRIFVDGVFEETFTFIPLLTVSNVLISQELLQTNTFTPSLVQSSQVLENADYIEEYTYTPDLTTSHTII